MASENHMTRDRKIAAHWARHLRFVEENHETWDAYCDEYREWLDLWAAESDNPAKCLQVIRRNWPNFEPTRFLLIAIEEDRLERQQAAMAERAA